MQLAVGLLAVAVRNVDTLGIEPRAFRMQSGCDTTAPCARVARMCAGLCSQEFARGVCGAGAPRPRSRGVHACHCELEKGQGCCGYLGTAAFPAACDAYTAQWSERLTADQQVPGSNPGVPYLLPS